MRDYYDDMMDYHHIKVVRKDSIYRKLLRWAIAIIVTLIFVVFQRSTGPTSAEQGIIITDNREYSLAFPRTMTTDDPTITLKTKNQTATGVIHWKTHKSNEAYQVIRMTNNADYNLEAKLPNKQKLDKIEYFAVVDGIPIFTNEPLILRYKDPVPAIWLILHVFLIFMAMLFAIYCIILSIRQPDSMKKYVIMTLWCLLSGGLIFGAIVQKYAFGVYWSGFPLGCDITDNKTLVAFLAVAGSLFFRNKTYFRYIAIASLVIMLAIFCIPHSIG